MSEKDAERLGILPEERHRWVRLDDAKANLALASGQARWFERVSVTIANGEEVGVLVPGDPAAASPQRASDEAIEAALVKAIGEAWRANHPLSDHPRAKERYAPAIVARALPCAQHAVEDVLVRLMTSGVVRRELVNPRTKSFGLRVTSLDERGPNHHDHEEA